MLTPPITTRLAALHDQERHSQAAHAHRITRARAIAPGSPAPAQASIKTTVASAGSDARSAIISLFTGSRRARPSIG